MRTNPAKGEPDISPLYGDAVFCRVQFPRGEGGQRVMGEGERRGIKGYPYKRIQIGPITRNMPRESPWRCLLPEVV